MDVKTIENIDAGRNIVGADIVDDDVSPIDKADAGGVYCYLCQEEHPFDQLQPLKASNGVFTTKVLCDMKAPVWVCLEHIPYFSSQFEAFSEEMQGILRAAHQAKSDSP